MMNWEARYEADDLPWNEGAAHPVLADYITAHGPFRGRILVPGCGLGHEVRALATPENEVTGLDLAPAAIRRAEAWPKAAEERYVAGDFFQPPPEFAGGFDWIVEHTCFCAIDPAMRARYAESAARILKPSGQLFAIFYLDPAADHQPPYGVSTAELDALFGPHFEVLEEWVPAHTFESREGRELVRLLWKRP